MSAFSSPEPYILWLTGAGVLITLVAWLPLALKRLPLSLPIICMAAGAAIFLIPAISFRPLPMILPDIAERLTEFVVIIALMGAGLKLDRLFSWRRWNVTWRLLGITMPLSIAAIMLIGVTLLGLPWPVALLLGACLAPTDPVLAADVQVGPPLEGGEHPVRFALTTEAGLNDGLAFPFVYLAIFIVAATGGVGEWIGEWLGFYVVYKIAVGVIAGCAAGWVLGRVLFTLPGDNPLANAGTGVIALAGVLVTYGLTELIEGYGFIAAFFMGLVLRRKEAEHEYHGRLHSFSSALEHSVTAVLLVLLGGAIPALLGYLDWQHALLGVALIFIIRPISGMLALWGDPMSLRQRGVVAFYGVRGIGSIYYLAYAGGQLNLVDEGALWATVTFTILLSTIVHGFSAGSVVWAATHEGERPSEPT